MQRNLFIFIVCGLLIFIFSQTEAFRNDVSKIISLISGTEKTENSIKTYYDQETQIDNSSVKIRDDISDPYFLTVNPPVALSGKTREEVYELRRHYIQSSIFDPSTYNPSEQVYGQIVDGKPWYSINFCWEEYDGQQRANVSGPSEETRFINNPTMLVAIEYPFGLTDKAGDPSCHSPVNQMIPTDIGYSKSKNEIMVKYDSLPYKAINSTYYQLQGQNAVDLGYKYMYVDMLRSTFQPDFSDKENNPSTKVQEFKNFIHVGYSCKHEGGCNNGSPRQPNLEFNYRKSDGAGEIYIKLWKTKPFTVMQKPDIAERIIIAR